MTWEEDSLSLSHCSRGGVLKKAAKNCLEKTSKKPAEKDKQQVAKQMAALEAKKSRFVLLCIRLLEYWTVELYYYFICLFLEIVVE
jgi:hypothetical protein